MNSSFIVLTFETPTCLLILLNPVHEKLFDQHDAEYLLLIIISTASVPRLTNTSTAHPEVRGVRTEVCTPPV